MRIIDLSTEIKPGHVRWNTERTAKGDTNAGDQNQVTTIKVSCHSFTHVDAQRHYFGGTPTIEATPLDCVVGLAIVVDLMDTQPMEAIGPEKLIQRASGLPPRSRVILKSGWHRHRSIETKEFWLDAPYVTREGAQWLYEQDIMTICYDFPQDYCIRLLLSDERRPTEEHVTHDILLRNGVHMVEYLTNTAELRDDRVFLSAAPLKIPEADGAPARVYAIEGLA